MGMSTYNGFPGPLRDAVGRRQARLWSQGLMAKPEKCDACYQTRGAIHGHAEDYSSDEIYLPICITCHLILHMRFQQPKLWEQYKEMVRLGWRGIPLEQHNALHQIKRLYLTDQRHDWPMEDVNEIRTATVLDMICPIRFTHPNALQPHLTGICEDAPRDPFDVP